MAPPPPPEESENESVPDRGSDPTRPDRVSAAAELAARRLSFEELLDEFRHTAVLVPLGDGSAPDTERGLLTADLYGIRFILAFSDEQALARCAEA